MRTTRRRYLATAGAALATGAAGCLGGLPGTSSGGAQNLDCDVPDQETVENLPQPSIGPSDAPVTVNVYEDFACPHCATFSTEVFPKVREQYVASGDVRYRHFDFPIPVSEQWSWGGAVAARAVQDRTDSETFFDFATAVYENQQELTSNGFQLVHDLAADRGVDGCAVVGAVEQETYRPVVEADRERAVSKGYQGTPTVVVDGNALQGYSWEAVSAAIDARLDA
jgi:protein-disulfide isomerase